MADEITMLVVEPKQQAAHQKSLAELVQWYESYEQATQTSRLLSERDRDYYDGKQWTAAEESVLRQRGQPVLTFNRIGSKIDFVLGSEIQRRTDPKAKPRTPIEDGGADVVTDAIRYVCDANNWDEERSSAWEDMAVEGTSSWDVRYIDGAIQVEHVPWDRLFWDPRSRYHDFRDAKYYGSVVWLDLEDALEMWPHAAEVLNQSVVNHQNNSDTHDDRPHFGIWTETARSRMRLKVCHMWYRCGRDWYTATLTQAGFLEDPRVSPYVDEHGASTPGLVIQSAKVDRNNDRYGLVRPLISPQDEINKRRSKSLHLLNARQVIAEQGAVADPRAAQQELAKPDGYIEVAPGLRFEVAANNDFAMGHFNLLADAKAEIDAIGANAALTGKDPRDQSGRALMARQQGGLTELDRVFDRMRYGTLRVYRQIWYRIRQFWTHEMWIRVTDSDEHMRWVPMNRPITAAEMLQQQGQQLPPPEIVAMDPMLQMQLGQVVAHQNRVTELDVDVVLDEAPQTAVLQEEQFAQLAQMAGSGVPIPPDVLIEASALRNKRELIERMRAGGATPQEQQAAMQQQQAAAQYQQAAAQLELQDKAAKIDKTKADTAAVMTKSKVDIHREARESANAAVQRAGVKMQAGNGSPMMLP